MVEIRCQILVPNFQMTIYTHEFFLEHDLIDDVLEYCKNLRVKNDEWDKYNLFNSDDPIIKKLAIRLHDEVSLFNANGEKRSDLWINGWFNIIPKNCGIKPHFHGAESHSYFSCNVSLDDYNTQTLFYPPWLDRHGHIIRIDNKKGQGMFFPQWLWHEVEPHEEPIRYTLGLDINTDLMMESADMSYPVRHSRKLNEFYT